ncbi:hypothetical protein [Citrobacter sp. Cb028]|uniref:hypothetical protein n=1 Tax=Citrobacter sp. Cb028 TaxID=2985024 RepID=UPI0025765F26|nr:hypothetical protein [Citrobacter sp. Cb028]MDM3455738.1 hypothetical protein [Citrobacter sp. Cb028]
MELDKIVELQGRYYENKRSATIGLYIIFVGVILIVVNILGWSHETQIIQGVVLGGGIVYWWMHFDKYTKLHKQLDILCLQRYRKGYDSSLAEIVSDRYGKKDR